jgi:hypothetical protein
VLVRSVVFWEVTEVDVEFIEKGVPLRSVPFELHWVYWFGLTDFWSDEGGGWVKG